MLPAAQHVRSNASQVAQTMMNISGVSETFPGLQVLDAGHIADGQQDRHSLR